MKRICCFIFSLFALQLFINGCGSSPQTINISLNCDDDCNNTNAVVVRIYQLRNAEKFKSTSFESLMQNAEEVLGDDIIPNSKYEKTLIPGESILLKELQIKQDATYLGVIGDFNSPAKDGWQQLIPLNEDIENLKISVHENSLSFKNE